MITLPNIPIERDAFWRKHIFVELSALLKLKGYSSTTNINHSESRDISVLFTYEQNLSSIIIKFRPNRKIYHYSFETSGCSYELMRTSRKFRWKNPDLTTLFDVFKFLSSKILEEQEIERLDKIKKEELQKKRIKEAEEIAKVIHCAVEVSYKNNFIFDFTTMEGRKIRMTFRLANNGDVEEFGISGEIKKHHFYSIIDSLRKSVSDSDGVGFVRKRRIDLTSDIVTRIAKNESIMNLQFSKIRSWKRNFNLEEGK